MRFKNKKVLVTGGAGFVGSNLVDALVKENAKVTVLDDLFTGRKGDLRENRIRQLFYHYAGKARLKGYSVHSLRHSRAVHLIEDGAGIEYVQDLLGHKNIQNTVVYAQISNKRRDELAKTLVASPMIVGT